MVWTPPAPGQRVAVARRTSPGGADANNRVDLAKNVFELAIGSAGASVMVARLEEIDLVLSNQVHNAVFLRKTPGPNVWC